MGIKSLAVVTAAAVAVIVGAAVPAAASGDNQVVGIEQAAGDPAGPLTSYTVSKILPSADPVAYPVAGQLYEATVMARATGGTVVPQVGSFTARADDGATYPVLAQVSSLRAAPLADGMTTVGKVYFDVVGPAPTSIVYHTPPAAPLIWHQPIPGEREASGSGGGSTGGDAGSQGVMGSTGPNDTSPSTPGGEIGGDDGGTEGGGGNLSSGGGSGAPNGDTGGDDSSGGGD